MLAEKGQNGLLGRLINSTTNMGFGAGLCSVIGGVAAKYYKDVIMQSSEKHNLFGLEAGAIFGGTFYLVRKTTKICVDTLLNRASNYSPNFSARIVGNAVKGLVDGFLAYKLTEIFSVNLGIPYQLGSDDLRTLGVIVCLSATAFSAFNKLTELTSKVDALENNVKAINETRNEIREMLSQLPDFKNLMKELKELKETPKIEARPLSLSAPSSPRRPQMVSDLFLEYRKAK